MNLIDKDALVAEIERRLGEYRTYSDYQIDSNYMELCDILSFVNTLEVKDVDLDKEIEKCLKQHSMLAVGKKDFTDIARHFFEFGLKVARKGE